jgi:hypothetical protein
MSFNILKFFSQVQNSLKGYVNFEELVKTIVTALGAGTTVLGLLQVLQTHLNTIVTDPTILSEIQSIVTAGISKNWIALIIAAVTLAVDLYRRFNHGVTPTPVPPVPTPTPTPTPTW